MLYNCHMFVKHMVCMRVISRAEAVIKAKTRRGVSEGALALQRRASLLHKTNCCGNFQACAPFNYKVSV